jgi:drug/metabolite transporter (DMT)-like permease
MLAFTALAWGAMFTVAKSALGSIDAYHLSAFRYAPAATVMLAILGLVEGKRALRLDGHGWRLAIYGTLGFAGFTILGFLGIAGSTPEHAAIIVALMPLVTALMNWVLRRRRPSPGTLAAMVVALGGVVLVVTRGHLRLEGGASWHADAMVLAGVVCWVVYTMGAADVPQFSALRYTALSMMFGAASIVAIALVATVAGAASMPTGAAVAATWEEIAYLALVAGVAAVLAWNAGIGALGPVNGVLFINLVPITAFAIGVAQGHRFGTAELAGAAMTLAALVASNLVTRRGVVPARSAAIAPAAASGDPQHRSGHARRPISPSPHAITCRI